LNIHPRLEAIFSHYIQVLQETDYTITSNTQISKIKRLIETLILVVYRISCQTTPKYIEALMYTNIPQLLLVYLKMEENSQFISEKISNIFLKFIENGNDIVRIKIISLEFIEAMNTMLDSSHLNMNAGTCIKSLIKLAYFGNKLYKDHGTNMIVIYYNDIGLYENLEKIHNLNNLCSESLNELELLMTLMNNPNDIAEVDN